VTSRRLRREHHPSQTIKLRMMLSKIRSPHTVMRIEWAEGKITAGAVNNAKPTSSNP
jgi:hypothetical protein